MSQQTRCTSHCSRCQRHFHSVAAFDAHRIGSYASNDPETGRRCAHPIDLGEKFTALTNDGICSMYAEPISGVTVWTLAIDLLRVRKAFSQLPRTSDHPAERVLA